MPSLTLLVGLLPSALAASHLLLPPSVHLSRPVTTSSNSTLPAPTIVKGQAFDRFIQIWLENTDFATANSSAISLLNYYALTHPSQPNYIATAGGDFVGLPDDSSHDVPANISTIVDRLEAKSISWASYQENLASNTFTGSRYAQIVNYVSYCRKHSSTVGYKSVQNMPKHLAASTLPQWLFVTPNIVNDIHNTTIDFSGSWLNYWLTPMLAHANFNNNRTLVLLTFGENSSSSINKILYSSASGIF
ncbi:hypothetical protein M422DRAFT_59683 [Sphaerobolus stellatus SS14]|uniref:Acid phosphatase n=1 Tax=Sphaerobolus stellatus (strain SS14) TaxID=990650 RepID=A0A0C9W2T6_SPHS4|nr:hypothetical protein M422DRAFT_59683 [Sphaerobolus stellatus SS14]